MTTIRDEALKPYIVEVEENNYCLIKEVVVQKGANVGKVNKEPKGYFTTMEGLIKGVVRDKIVSDNQIYSMKDFLKRWKELQGEFAELFKKAGL